MARSKSKNKPDGVLKSSSGLVTEGLKMNELEEQNFSQVLSDCFARYAKMVLTDRAIPDVRDGLKPVQRRIIFDMWKQGITAEKKTVKCAKTVGDVLGNFHPHGDSSVYDAMVRLSQDWKMEVPLLTFQGNNGSIDNDPAAAYRYTEAKLAVAASLMTQDLSEDTVDMMLTFDDMNTEPVVLPAGFPNLLINGAQGIAVGNNTNIPTHNPDEIVSAVIYRLEHPDCTLDDLLKIVKGPDFPTGGIVDDKESLQKLYATGHASFYIYSRAHIDNDKNQIIITEIPYGDVKSQMVADLDEKRIKYRLDNIQEVRDESAEDIRIVLDIRKGANPQDILDYLNSKGLLRTTFAANMMVLDKGHPRTLGLLPIIDAYVAHREEVITRRSKFELNKSRARLEIVDGLLSAADIIDKVIACIRKASSRAEAKQNLMNEFKFTANQADAIGNMRLYSLTRLDIVALSDEEKELLAAIDRLTLILSSKNTLDEVVSSELKEALKIISHPRRTEIRDTHIGLKTVDQKTLIAAEDVMVVMTRDGYAKRTNMRSWQSSVNGESVVADLPAIKVGDVLAMNRKCSTHDDILAFTSSGNYFVLPVWQIPECKWREEGKHLSTLISLGSQEKIVKAFLVKKMPKGLNLILLSKGDKLKRFCLDEISLEKMTTRPLRAMALTEDDQVIDAALAAGDSSVIVWAQDGNVNRFNEKKIPLVGLKAGGVKAMNLPKPCDMALLTVLPHGVDMRMFVVTDGRRATVLKSMQIQELDRLGAKTQAVKISATSKCRLVGIDAFLPERGKKKSEILALSTGSMELDISDMAPAELGFLLRTENVSTDVPNAVVRGIHSEGEVIDEKTPVHIAPQNDSKPVKAKSDGNPKQPTFFDMIDTDAGWGGDSK